MAEVKRAKFDISLVPYLLKVHHNYWVDYDIGCQSYDDVGVKAMRNISPGHPWGGMRWWISGPGREVSPSISQA